MAEYENDQLEEQPEHLEDAYEDEASEPEHQNIPAGLKKILKKAKSEPNLLIDMPEGEINDLKERVVSGYEMDLNSMKDYLDRYGKIVNLAIMKSEVSDKTFPFQGASRVMMPELARSGIEFQSRLVPEIVNRRDIISVYKWGQPDEDKALQGERRASAINYQFKKGIKNWSKNQDRALLILAIGGMFFKKTWWCCHKIMQSVITADRMIYDHDSDSFDEAPRKSTKFFLDPNDFESCVRDGMYLPIEELEKQKQDGKQPEVEEPLELIESHCTLDLDGDGYCEPYIVTWSRDYDQLIRVECRFNEDDVEVKNGQVVEIHGEDFFTQYILIPNPEKAAIGDGFGTLLYDALKALNTMYRQALDASTLSIVAANSGFISSNLKPAAGRSKSGRAELIMGQFSKVDMGAGQSMRDMIWTPQFNGVPNGFYQMLNDLREQIMGYCAASQTLEVSGNEAASLYLGRLQQALKVPNAITSRVYTSVSEEACRIDYLLQKYLPDEEYKEVVDWHPKVPQQVQMQYQQAMQAWQQQGRMMGMEPPQDPTQVAMSQVTKEHDYTGEFEFITTADPTLGSYEERVARAEMIADRATNMPQLYNAYECERNFIAAIGESKIDTLLPEPTGQPSQQDILMQQMTQAEIAKAQADAQHKAAQATKANVTAQLEQMKAESEIDLNMSNVMKNLQGVDESQAWIRLQAVEAARKDLEMALRHIESANQRGHEMLLKNAEMAHQVAMKETPEQEAAESPQHEQMESPEEETSEHHERVILRGHPKHGDIKVGDILKTAKKHGISPQDVLHHMSKHNIIAHHPRHGAVTHGDIIQTARENNISPREAMQRIFNG